jgi:hypothetical protein
MDARTAGRPRRLSTETKQAFKSTEFWAYVVVLLGVLIAGAAIDQGTEGDPLKGDKIWLYVVILTVGYMISRGLAKSGSRDPYDQQATSSGDSLGDRVKTAAQVLTDGPGATEQTTQATHPADGPGVPPAGMPRG